MMMDDMIFSSQIHVLLCQTNLKHNKN